MKTCQKCASTKPIEQFRHFINRHGKNYVENTCRQCHSVRTLERRKPFFSTPEGKVEHSRRVQQSKRKHTARVRQDHAKRRAAMATPAWSDTKAMKQHYIIARFLSNELGVQFHVDHIVPLNSDQVCGLHTQGNLAVLPAFVNLYKGNSTWVDMP